MSLSVDGVWKAGVWATTVWASGVWQEGAASAASPGSTILLPPIPLPENWLPVAAGFDIEGDKAFEALARRSEVEALIRSALAADEALADLDEMDGLEPDEELFGGRRRR